MELVVTIIATVISGLMLTSFGFIARRIMRKFNSILSEFKELKESQRNQIKSQIVARYEYSKREGYITYLELETTNRLADSYFALGGNNYVHALMGKINSEVEVRGEPIPEV